MVNWNNNIAKLTLPTPFPVGDINVYVVKGDALTLFDTGVNTMESRDALTYQLGELGLKMTDIEQVILTHHHPDHAGALDFFAQDVPVYGHRNNQRWLERNKDFIEWHNQFFRDYARQNGIADELHEKLLDYREIKDFFPRRKLSGFLQQDDSLPGLSEWSVVETLGHAQGHLSFYREKDGVLIGGDLLIEKVSPNPIMEPSLFSGEERLRPLLQHNESLKKIQEMSVSVVYSGHGEDIENVNELIEYRMTRQHNRAMHVKKMLEEQPSTAFEICKKLFSKVYYKQIGLTMSETIGQLDYLENLGDIQSEGQSGVTRYQIV